MAVSLVKGQNILLNSSLTRVYVELGWDAKEYPGEPFDLDASVFMLNSFRKVRSDADFIFYNQCKSQCGSVFHHGDELEGGVEQVEVNLSLVPADVERIVFVVTIYDAERRGQNFGQVDNAFIRVVDLTSNEEIARFDLTEDACVEQSVIFGELYRNQGAWKFKALGHGLNFDLGVIARNYGVNVES